MHQNSHPLAGKTVKIKENVKHFQYPDFGGSDFVVEDWWDKLTGTSWINGVDAGNAACVVYAVRILDNNLPLNEEVLYGKVGHFGSLVHISELEEE